MKAVLACGRVNASFFGEPQIEDLTEEFVARFRRLKHPDDSDTSQAMSATNRYASNAFRGELVGSPAIVMAIGIFLLFPARFLLGSLFHAELVNDILSCGAILLGLFYVCLVLLFTAQWMNDHTVLWGYSSSFFRMGTWVAGTNVLARVVHPLSTLACTALSAAGWILWLLYMTWLIRTIRRTRLREILHGTAFLTTVATQSVVLGILALSPEPGGVLVCWLLALNALGIAFYCVFFYLIWLVRGVKLQIANWTPPNNITHGALSISLLASEMLAVKTVNPSQWVLLALDIVWVVDAVFFALIAVTELWLLFTGAKPLLAFQVSNYARNFTYGMFFACTYYGYTHLKTSVIHSLFTPGIFFVLAGTVLVINIWEVSHQIFTYWKPDRTEKVTRR